MSSCSLAMEMSANPPSTAWWPPLSSTSDMEARWLNATPSILDTLLVYRCYLSIFEQHVWTPKVTKNMQLRLAIWVLLNTSPAGFFCLLAVVCTSFSAMNIATSKRSPCTPFGDTTLPHVRATLFAFFLGIIFFHPIMLTIPFHILRLETCYSPEAFCYAIWPYVSTVH